MKNNEIVKEGEKSEFTSAMKEFEKTQQQLESFKNLLDSPNMNDVVSTKLQEIQQAKPFSQPADQFQFNIDVTK